MQIKSLMFKRQWKCFKCLIIGGRWDFTLIYHVSVWMKQCCCNSSLSCLSLHGPCRSCNDLFMKPIKKFSYECNNYEGWNNWPPNFNLQKTEKYNITFAFSAARTCVILNKLFQNKMCYNNLEEVCIIRPFTFVGYLNNKRLLVLPEWWHEVNNFRPFFTVYQWTHT